MGEVIEFQDGFGVPVGFQYPMACKRGSHVAYAKCPDLIVEWYDFGDHAPYESANLLIFDRSVLPELAKALGADERRTAHELACVTARRFESYFDVERFAEDHAIGFTKDVDFSP